MNPKLHFLSRLKNILYLDSKTMNVRNVPTTTTTATNPLIILILAPPLEKLDFRKQRFIRVKEL